MNLLFLGKRARIERAIARGDYERAKDILQKYDESSFSLFSEEIKKLDKKIKKFESISKLNKAVDEYEVKEAETIFSEIKSTISLTGAELTDLEAKIQSVSVDGFLRKLSRTKGKESLALADKIAELYPEAEKEALREGLTEGVSYLLNIVREKEDFTTSYQELKEINKVLEKHKTNGLPINHLIDVALLVKTLEAYLESPEGKYTTTTEPLKVGDQVRTQHNNSAWTRQFVADRTKNFPLGSVGKIIDTLIHKNRSLGKIYIVEFEEKTGCFWSEAYQTSSPYWAADEKRNIAAYSSTEVKKVTPVNEIDKKKFLEEVKQLENLINNHYSQEVPKKKRHNPEITEEDKVLPRSD